MSTNFHLSLPCYDIEKIKDFYVNMLGVKIGRNTNSWVDINLFENQITYTKSGNFNFEYKNYRFDNQVLPSFHFGIILSFDKFNTLYNKLLDENMVDTPKTKYMENMVGEHVSFFIKDPNNYLIEFKCFKNSAEVFETNKTL